MILLFDKKLTKTVDSLRGRGESRADVIRCAIALMKVVTEADNRGDMVVLRAKDGTEQKIVLS